VGRDAKRMLKCRNCRPAEDRHAWRRRIEKVKDHVGMYSHRRWRRRKKKNNINKVRAVRIYTYIYVIIGGHSRYWVLAAAYLAYD